MSISRPAAILAGALFVLFASLRLRADDTQANLALQHGRVEEAANLLQATIAANPSDATAHQLLCRVFYAQDLGDRAVDECQKAVEADPKSSENQMWLGRALGLKTGQVGKFSQIGLAKQVRAAFERAVALDPHNAVAASDLGEFYIHAPGFMGGGTDKAQKLAQSIMSVSPTRAHRMLAQIAQKNGDNTTAENEYNAAIAVDKTAESYVDLAIFYQQTHQTGKILPTLTKAIAADHNHGPAEADAASILAKDNLAPDVAEKAWRDYLKSNAQTDEVPTFKAHVQLGNLLAKKKDKAGARSEYMAALALAPNYAPARKALQAS